MIINQLKTIVLLGALSALLIGFGGQLGPGMFWLFTALAVVMNLGAYFFSDTLVLKMNGARLIGPTELPWLHAVVRDLARRAEIPMPRLAIVPADYANAFATGRNPSRGVVAVTEGLLRLMSRREIEGVLAHEIAHIRNRDILVSSVAAAIAAALSYLANAVQWAAIFGGGQQNDEEGGSPLGTLALAVVAPIAGLLVQMGISRSREYMADETAARLTGDPEGLALALERLTRATAMAHEHPAPATASLFIVNPFSGIGSRLLSWFSTHPPVADRVARLRRMARGRHLAA